MSLDTYPVAKVEAMQARIAELERDLEQAKADRARAAMDARNPLLEELAKLEAWCKRLEEAVKFADDFIATLQVGEEDMEHRDWIRAVADARIAYVSAKRSAKEAKP